MSGTHSDINDAAKDAWGRIKEEGLTPSPAQYELWFRYYDGDPEIRAQIDRYKGKMTDKFCQALIEKYITGSNVNNAMEQINNHLQKALAEIADSVGNMQNATSSYGDSLLDMNHQLKDAKSIEDLESIIINIATDTKKMADYNKDLEQQLETSSAQVNILKESLDTVRHEAMTDGLTGISNRKSFDLALDEALEIANSEDQDLTLLLLDIDHFKAFNDNFGHQIGDQVLRLVARCLVDGVKGRDKAARYGGEEFAIILPDTTLNSGIVVGDALRKSVENREVINKTSNQNLGQITLSVGVAEYRKGEKKEDLIERADTALYTAKENGRNQVAAERTE